MITLDKVLKARKKLEKKEEKLFELEDYIIGLDIELTDLINKLSEEDIEIYFDEYT